MATYNGEQYLKEQLDSIYAQTYNNIEVIVCDDCSSDSTIKILEEYRQKYGLMYYQNKVNLGYVKNFEQAIKLCKGDYIALSDQDDIWFKDKLECLLNSIKDNDLIHSDCELIDETGKTIRSSWKGNIKSHTIVEDFLFSNVVTGCTTMIKKDFVENILPFPDGLVYHDWYLGVNAAKNNKIIYLNKPLIQYRQHNNQDTGVIRQNKILETLRRLFGQKTLRMIGIEKQLRSLKSIYHLKQFSEHRNLIAESIEYFNRYMQSVFHPKMFFLGCKFKKYIFHKNNFFCIKNIGRDIIG